jgi:hypothetical protein
LDKKIKKRIPPMHEWGILALGTSGSKEETKPPEWELFDLKNDPYEIKNLYTTLNIQIL